MTVKAVISPYFGSFGFNTPSLSLFLPFIPSSAPTLSQLERRGACAVLLRPKEDLTAYYLASLITSVPEKYNQPRTVQTHHCVSHTQRELPPETGGFDSAAGFCVLSTWARAGSSTVSFVLGARTPDDVAAPAPTVADGVVDAATAA